MIEVKDVPPHHRVVKEEPRKKEGLKKKKEPKKKEPKKKEGLNQGRCCIRQDKGRKAACEDQKND
jgi:hypothetical protein